MKSVKSNFQFLAPEGGHISPLMHVPLWVGKWGSCFFGQDSGG